MPDDAYALTWQQTVVDINGGSDFDIYTAIYNALGQEILAPVNVSASDGAGDQGPKIAALSNGNYVLTWTSTPLNRHSGNLHRGLHSGGRTGRRSHERSNRHRPA